MADDQVTQMASDPDFGKMPLSEQRKALSAHDSGFGQMADGEITNFVAAHQKSQAPATGIPDANAQAKQVLQKIPQYTSKTDELTQNLARAQSSPQYNDYMRQSGRMIGETAGTMAGSRGQASSAERSSG